MADGLSLLHTYLEGDAALDELYLCLSFCALDAAQGYRRLQLMLGMHVLQFCILYSEAPCITLVLTGACEPSHHGSRFFSLFLLSVYLAQFVWLAAGLRLPAGYALAEPICASCLLGGVVPTPRGLPIYFPAGK